MILTQYQNINQNVAQNETWNCIVLIVLEVPCLEVVHVHKEFEDPVGYVTLIQHVLNLKQ